MVSFNLINDEDNEENLWSKNTQKFGLCESPDECYVCTGRVIINFELHRVEEESDSLRDYGPIIEGEIIMFCINCLKNMKIPVETFKGIFSWEIYEIKFYNPFSTN